MLVRVSSNRLPLHCQLSIINSSHSGFFLLTSYRFPFFNSLTAWSAARAVNAIYVNEGFWQAAEAINDPSVTNTFGASHTWLNLLSTEDFGSFPILAVPISWMPLPR